MPEEEKKEDVVVTINTNSNIVKPIPINSNEAMNIARAQSIKGSHIQEEVKEEVKPIENVEEMKQQLDINSINQVNDLVKIVEVKNNKKTIAILALILIVLAIIFVVFELPMLRGL